MPKRPPLIFLLVLLSFAVEDATRRSGIQARTVAHGDPLASGHRPLVVTPRFTE